MAAIARVDTTRQASIIDLMIATDITGITIGETGDTIGSGGIATTGAAIIVTARAIDQEPRFMA